MGSSRYWVWTGKTNNRIKTCYCDSNSEVRKDRQLSAARVYYMAYVWNGQRINLFFKKSQFSLGQWFRKWTEWCDSSHACCGMEGRPPIQTGHVTFLWEWTTEPRPEDWATCNTDNLGRRLWTWERGNGEATWWNSSRVSRAQKPCRWREV